jgi:Lar family restriction alleviation protein
MSEEKKPCPFCSSTSLCFDEDDAERRIALCRKCGASAGWRNRRKDALTAWNARPIEDTLRARVAELETACQCALNRFIAIKCEQGRPVDSAIVIRMLTDALGRDTGAGRGESGQ